MSTTPPTPPGEDPQGPASPDGGYDPRTSADAQGTGPRSGSDFGRSDRPSSASEPGLGSAPDSPTGPSRPSSSNPRPQGRPGGAGADKVNSGKEAALDKAAAADPRAKALNDARKDMAAGTPKDEAAIKAAAVAGANSAVDGATGGAGTAIRSSSKAGAKAGELFDKAVAKGTQAGYSRYKKGIGIALTVALLAGVALFAASVPTITDRKDDPTDACTSQLYSANAPDAPGLTKAQQENFRLIYQAAIKHNMGINTAALATYVSWYESGMQQGTARDSSNNIRSFAGPFQQSVGWYKSDMEASSDPAAYQASFGTANDPRLDTEKAAFFFMRAFKDVLTSEGVKGAEPQEEIRWALTELGINTDSRNWWQAWKNTDLSSTLTDPSKAEAVLVLAHAVQNFAPAGQPVRSDLGTKDARNAMKKFPASIPVFATILKAASAQAQMQDAEVSQAADAAALAHIGVPVGPESGSTLTGHGVFVLGDSISNYSPIRNSLEDAGYVVDAVDGRPASVDQWQVLGSNKAAVGAEVWIIELGTNNNGNNPGDVHGWVNGVAAQRNPATNQQVYWVMPWRPDGYRTPDGLLLDNTDKLVAAFKVEAKRVNDAAVAAGKAPWLHLLPWNEMVTELGGNPSWFKGDPYGIHPHSEAAIDNFTSLLLGASPGNISAQAAVLEDCTGGPSQGLDLSDPRLVGKKKVVSWNGKNDIKDGPAPADAQEWVPKVIARAEYALIDSPCDYEACYKPDGEGGLVGLCASLAVRIQGQQATNTQERSAYGLYKVYAARGEVHEGSDRYTPPVGAMLFWGQTPSNAAGHVATYVGNGMLVSNYRKDGSYPPGVYLVPARMMIDGYANYKGWALPTESWRKSKSMWTAAGAPKSIDSIS